MDCTEMSLKSFDMSDNSFMTSFLLYILIYIFFGDIFTLSLIDSVYNNKTVKFPDDERSASVI